MESPHTTRSKLYDLWKFTVFFLRRFPQGDLSVWDKPCSQAFVNTLEQEYDIATVERIYATILNFWNFLVIQEAVKAKDNPLAGVNKRNREQLPPARGIDVISNTASPAKRFSSKEKYTMCLDAARSFFDKPKAHQSPLRDIAIFATLYKTGIRADELCSLIEKQLDRDVPTGGCWIHDVHCKGKRTRRVYLPIDPREYLDDYLGSEERDKTSPYVFQSRNGNRLHQKDIWKILDRIAKRATTLFLPPGQVFRMSPHALRHERGLNLRKAGYGERFIAHALGHADTTQVPRYSIGDDVEEAESLEKA